MSNVRRVKNKYVVYDHILDLNKVFKSKAEADEYAEELTKRNKPQTDNLNPIKEDVN